MSKKNESYPMKRNLDGYYFRVHRNGRWQNICFTDLTLDEKKQIMKDKDDVWLQSLALGLADVIREIGYIYDIAGSWGDSLD